MRRITVFVFIGLLVASQGCKSAAPSASGATAKPSVAAEAPPMDGTPVQSAGYAFVLPKSWAIADLTREDVEASLKAAWKDRPELLAQISAITPLADQEHFKLMAFDPDKAGSGFADNLNVLVEKMPRAMSAQQVLDANLAQLKDMAQGKPTSEVLEIAGKPAGHIVWKTTMGSSTLAYQTYILLNGSDATIFTFTTVEGRADAMADLAKKVMSTVKVQP